MRARMRRPCSCPASSALPGPIHPPILRPPASTRPCTAHPPPSQVVDDVAKARTEDLADLQLDLGKLKPKLA